MTELSTRFRRAIDLTTDGLVVKPVLENYLFNAKFPDVFDVRFHKAGKARKPDGWFHPSTHPLWTERQLFYYLTEPDLVEAEQLSYESRMAVTMGTAVHAFIEHCVRDAGLMAPLEGTCPCCHRQHGTGKGQCDEYGASDESMRSRGHMDGNLVLPKDGKFTKAGLAGFEFKTINARALYGMNDLDLDTFRQKKPEYYAQVQNYMETTGLTQFVVLFISLGFPWQLVEIQVPYDPEYALNLRRKYQYVVNSVEENDPPDPCCAPRSEKAKACPVRFACPIGRA